MKNFTLLLTTLCLSGCLGMPQTIQPVQPFKLDKYLGKWYEIARLDHSFERGLTQVTAQYSMRSDGGVSVVNRGYSISSNEWEQAEGKAYFVNSENEGYLKVSFFGPFYGSYVVFELEQENYDYAFVSGPNNDYLWLLSRKPEVSAAVKVKFEQLATEHGFDVDQLIYVQQQ